MIKNKQDKKIAIFVLIALLVGWLCHYPPFAISTRPFLRNICGLLRPLIYIGLCTAWSISISRTIINRRLRSYLQWIAGCCIFWLVLRTIKWELTVRNDSVNIFLLHAIFIPFILLPTFGFFISLYARKGDRYEIPKWIYRSVYAVSFAAILFVLTNPVHRLYWVDTPGDVYDATHGPGYALVAGWIAILMLMAVINIIVRAKIPGKAAASAPPLFMIGVILGFAVMDSFLHDLWKWVSGDWTSLTCLLTIGLMQACITSGLIPSNRGYAQLFEAAGDGAMITDNDWNICYASRSAERLPRETLKKTAAGMVTIDSRTVLKGRKLHPGHVIWREDISAISELLERMNQNRKELAVKNELEKENNRAELALAKVQEKNRLYDISQTATSGQNKRLQDTLSRYFEETDEGIRKGLLAQASVLGAYIKRKGNLIFAGDGGTVKASELRLAFQESLRNLELLQSDCHMVFSLPDDEELSVRNAHLLYDTFEIAVETILPDVDDIFLRILEDSTGLQAIYSLVSSQDLSAAVFPNEAVVEQDEDTWIISLKLSKGGGAK